MKVALIGPVYPYRGGIAHYTTMLCRVLREHGHEVLIISFKRQYPQWLFPGRSDKDPSNEPLMVEDAEYWIDSLNPMTWIRTHLRISGFRPDIVILQWWTTFWSPVWNFLALLNQLFLKSILVFICHNVFPHEVRFWDKWLTKITLRWGEYWIVSSLTEKKRLYSLGFNSRVEVVPLPVFNILIENRMTKKDARKELSLPVEAPVVLFFGIVREYKGLLDLIKAMGFVRQQLGVVYLLVAGEFWVDRTPYISELKRLDLIETAIIDDRYIPNEEVAVYFSAADILVAPYRRKTGSAVIQLAHAFGIPVITTALGENSFEYDRIVPSGKPEALADEIVRFFGNDLAQGSEAKYGEAGSWKTLLHLIEDIGA
jgi:glycosyltransferase involved in cell wall biosynthesis